LHERLRWLTYGEKTGWSGTLGRDISARFVVAVFARWCSAQEAGIAKPSCTSLQPASAVVYYVL